MTRTSRLGGGAKKGGPKAIGPSRGGLTTKIHARVEALANPVQLELTEGQCHDYILAKTLTENVTDADRCYDGETQ